MFLNNFMSSMTTGLILLALIGAASAIGSSLWPDTFFRTLPFRLLLLLLFANMTWCTFNKLKRFRQQKKQNSKNWRLVLRNIGLLMLHGGIVLILMGAAFYSFLGHNVRLSILEGDMVNIDKVIPAEKPFSLTLREFTIEFNKDGSPAQYYSDLELLEPGKKPLKKQISVNHPLVYGGVKAYQNSYGYLTEVGIKDENNFKSTLAKDGDFIQFTATKRTLKVFRYVPNFDPEMGLETKTEEPVNPRIIYSVYNGQKLLGAGAAPLGEQIKIDEEVFIKFQQIRPYTTLVLKTDPGLPLVSTGGLFLMSGVCLVFLVPVRKKERD